MLWLCIVESRRARNSRAEARRARKGRAEAWRARKGRAEAWRAIRGTRFACAAHNLHKGLKLSSTIGLGRVLLKGSVFKIELLCNCRVKAC